MLLHSKPRVLVLVQTQQAYGRDIVEGIVRRGRQSRSWELLFYSLLDDIAEVPLSNPVAGIISEVRMPARRKWLEAQRVPRVIISGNRPVRGAGWVVADNYAVGRMAFEHLAGLGFTRFAWCGDRDRPSSVSREQGFREAMKQAGYTEDSLSALLLEQRDPDFAIELPELSPWIASLPKPVGIFAATLDYARHITHACRELGVYVPEHAAVLGVNNDPLTAHLSEPSLTSIDHGAREIGYQAARLLEHMLAGAPAPAEPVVVAPVGVAQRQSTNIMAVAHPHVARALRLIREHGTEPMNVADILAQLPVSRRALETAFLRHLNRTPHEELTRVRIDHAKLLLRETKLPLAEIALKCGYRYASQLSTVFKSSTGMTPRSYQQKSQAASDAKQTLL